MKKIVLVCLSLLLVTGCNTKSELDMTKIKENINLMKTEEFDISQVSYIVEDTKLGYFENLTDFYLSDMKQIGINSDYILEMTFRVKEDKTPAYIIVKPTDNNKDNLKKQLESYLANYTYEMEEYDQYLIYVFDEHKSEKLELIKQSKKNLFNNLYQINDNNFYIILGFNTDAIEDYAIEISTQMNVERYFVLKPKSGYKKELKKVMQEYFTNLEEEWGSTDDVKLIESRLEKEYNDYLIYIISNDNNAVLKTIENSKK